jgi:hypothetical protein
MLRMSAGLRLSGGSWRQLRGAGLELLSAGHHQVAQRSAALADGSRGLCQVEPQRIKILQGIEVGYEGIHSKDKEDVTLLIGEAKLDWSVGLFIVNTPQ